MRTRYFLASLTTLLLLPAAVARAQEKAVTRADLPPAVRQALAAQSRGATVRGLTRETEDGQVFYEAEMTVNGRGKDVLMDTSGTVVEVEEQVTLDSLPSSVRSALQKKAEGGSITRVESLTKRGRLVAYEAVVETGGKHREIQVGPQGETLDHEE